MRKHTAFTRFAAVAALFVSTALPAAVAAQEAVELEGDVKVVRMVGEEGAQREEMQEPTSVVPGDRLMFATNYRNGSTDVMEDFVITNPLPGAVMLAESGDFMVSLDGETYGALSDLTVDNGDGTSRPAELADVTHIQWTLDRLEPGASGSVTYFAVVR